MSILDPHTSRHASSRAPKRLPYKPIPKFEQQQVETSVKPPVIKGKQESSRESANSSITELTPRGRFGSPVEWVVYVTAAFLGLHVFYSYFYSFDACSGVSMVPTIDSFGDWVWISKYYRRGRGIVVGDLVSFKSPIRDGEQAIKRVIGLPGDFVLMNTPGKNDDMIQVRQHHPTSLRHTNDR